MRQHTDVASDLQHWADQAPGIAGSDPQRLILVIADVARSDLPMVSAFVAELVRRLQDHGLALALPLAWVEQRLAESGLTREQMVESETQQPLDLIEWPSPPGAIGFDVGRETPGACRGAGLLVNQLANL